MDINDPVNTLTGIKGLLLDFDGTITEPFFNWHKIKKEIGINPNMPVLEYVRTNPNDKKRTLSIMAKHEESSVKHCKLNVGARGLIDFLNTNNIPFAVVTNNREENIRKTCKRLGIRIDNVIGRDSGVFKPSPEPLKLAAKKLNLNAGELAFVGDNKIDIIASHKAGITSIYLSENKDLKCNFCIKDLFELLDTFKNLFKKQKSY